VSAGSIITGAEGALEVAVPGLRSAKVAIYAIGGLIVAGLLGFAFWWFFIHPRQLAQQAGQAKVDARLGTAKGDIATRAIPQINDAARQKVEVDVQVSKGTIDVRTASDAHVGVGGVSDAARRNICLYDLYAADPACIALHEDPAGVGPAGRDGGGTRRPD
jgi:hypothetical protein